MAERINPVAAAWHSVMGLRTSPPAPAGTETFDHHGLQPVLDAVATGGIAALEDVQAELARYRADLEAVRPNELAPAHGLAYWINAYNANALDVAARAARDGHGSVYRMPGAFDRTTMHVAGERLALVHIEHGKLRRLGDPRIHGALVCGAVSCPTLRFEPFSGAEINLQLDDQMARFLSGGGFTASRSQREVALSRIFLWFGADFVRPWAMPAWLPARRRRTLEAASRWLDDADAAWVRSTRPRIRFLPYDYALGCRVR